MLRTAAPTSRAAGLARLIGPVFFLSGFASLVYQVAWQRMLTLYYGVGPVSVALIVSVFMLGLGLGGLAGGRAAERLRNPGRAYCLIELALGGFGLASLPLLDRIGRLTAASGYAVTALSCAVFLLTPTLLMGATLPIMLKLHRRHSADYLQSLSVLYFLNTLGAALGALLTGYVLISFFGVDGAVLAAAGVNVALAFAVGAATRRLAPAAPQPTHAPRDLELFGRRALALVFVTGFLAVGYEILWLLGIQQITKDSPYSFAAALFVYLLGIALGSLLLNRAARGKAPETLRSAFFLFQVLIALYVAATLVGFRFALTHTVLGTLARVTDSFKVHPPPLDFAAGAGRLWAEWGSLGGLYRLGDTFFWAGLLMLVPTLLMGASFPLVAYLAHGNDHPQEARATGALYFSNVLGNVLGAAVTGFLLIPLAGSEGTFRLFVVAGLLFGLGIARLFGRAVPVRTRAGVVALLAAAVVMAFPAHGEFLYGPAPPFLRLETTAGEGFFDEGVSGIVYSRRSAEGFGVWINGLGHGGRLSAEPLEGRPEFYMQAYGALRAAPSLERVLVIGLGTGSTAEAVLTMPTLGRLTIVEINETLLRNLARQPFFPAIRDDPRVAWVVDDARRLLTREATSYDLVLMDPLRETTIYSNHLYSRQFFELVRSRLTPGGVLMAWLQSPEQENTLAAVFRHAKLECSAYGLGSDQPLAIRHDVERVIAERVPPEVAEAIRRRRGRCREPERALSFDATVPVLEDTMPMLEYHLGSQYRRFLARRGSG